MIISLKFWLLEYSICPAQIGISLEGRYEIAYYGKKTIPNQLKQPTPTKAMDFSVFSGCSSRSSKSSTTSF